MRLPGAVCCVSLGRGVLVPWVAPTVTSECAFQAHERTWLQSSSSNSDGVTTLPFLVTQALRPFHASPSPLFGLPDRLLIQKNSSLMERRIHGERKRFRILWSLVLVTDHETILIS